MRRPLLPLLVLLGAAALLLVGVVVAGRGARWGLRDDARFSAAFDDIACEPPPGTDRLSFLHEVQYLARLPDRLRTLDDGLPAALADAFGRHPWVARVDEVRVRPHGPIAVRLTFRTPVLAVQGGAAVRAVDGTAVLLPATAAVDGLPTFAAASRPGADGRTWDDPAVKAAAAVAGYLHEHRDRLAVERFTVGDEGVVVMAAGGRFVWGSVPGREAPGEEPAAAKLERLAAGR